MSDISRKALDSKKLMNWIANNPQADGFWNGERSRESFDNLTDAIELGVFDIPTTESEGEAVIPNAKWWLEQSKALTDIAASYKAENERLRATIESLPSKIMNIDSIADDTLNFPLDNPTEEEQTEWFDEFCRRFNEHMCALIEEALSSHRDDARKKNNPNCPNCGTELEDTRNDDFYCEPCHESFGKWGDGSLIEPDREEALNPIIQAIRDFMPTAEQRAGYEALVAWLESTTPFTHREDAETGVQLIEWTDGVPPDFTGQDYALITVELPSRFSGCNVVSYKSISWLGESWSDKEVYRANRWVRVPLPGIKDRRDTDETS